jgi:hypothetical protein
MRVCPSKNLIGIIVVLLACYGCTNHNPYDNIASPPAQPSENVLRAELRNAIALPGNIVELNFVLINTSDNPISLAERWNSWGAHQWKFIVNDAEGRIFNLENPQQKWLWNNLTSFTIPPQTESIMTCRLDANALEAKDGSIMMFSAVFNHPPYKTVESWAYPISITGTFSAPEKYGKDDTAADRRTNWSGTVKTAPVIVQP